MPTALKRCMIFNKMSVAAIFDALSDVHLAKKTHQILWNLDQSEIMNADHLRKLQNYG
jgi:hypothetical protein